MLTVSMGQFAVLEDCPTSVAYVISVQLEHAIHITYNKNISCMCRMHQATDVEQCSCLCFPPSFPISLVYSLTLSRTDN